LNDIIALDFFNWSDTTYVACETCYSHFITLNCDDQVKTVAAVDGGRDTPGRYWQVLDKIEKQISGVPPE
jgi:hypothetical protein